MKAAVANFAGGRPQGLLLIRGRRPRRRRKRHPDRRQGRRGPVAGEGRLPDVLPIPLDASKDVSHMKTLTRRAALVVAATSVALVGGGALCLGPARCRHPGRERRHPRLLQHHAAAVGCLARDRHRRRADLQQHLRDAPQLQPDRTGRSTRPHRPSGATGPDRTPGCGRSRGRYTVRGAGGLARSGWTRRTRLPRGRLPRPERSRNYQRKWASSTPSSRSISRPGTT